MTNNTIKQGEKAVEDNIETLRKDGAEREERAKKGIETIRNEKVETPRDNTAREVRATRGLDEVKTLIRRALSIGWVHRLHWLDFRVLIALT